MRVGLELEHAPQSVKSRVPQKYFAPNTVLTHRTSCVLRKWNPTPPLSAPELRICSKRRLAPCQTSPILARFEEPLNTGAGTLPGGGCICAKADSPCSSCLQTHPAHAGIKHQGLLGSTHILFFPTTSLVSFCNWRCRDQGFKLTPPSQQMDVFT